jgi:hypothetical protein
VLEATEQAREKAKPYTDKALDTAKEASDQAKQAAERAAEAAKPYYDKSKEAAQKAYDDALQHRQGADGQAQAGGAEDLTGCPTPWRNVERWSNGVGPRGSDTQR